MKGAWFYLLHETLYHIYLTDPLSEQLETNMVHMSRANTRSKADQAAGPMLLATRVLLKLFYHPFNQKLASVLDDKNFLWSKSEEA